MGYIRVHTRVYARAYVRVRTVWRMGVRTPVDGNFIMPRTVALESDMEDWEDFTVDSVVRGHHAYKSIWTPFLEEVLRVEMEERNKEDRYAVAILKDSGVVVGHVPCSFSKPFYFFLRHGGSIECKITGHRKFRNGLEVPCTYTLSGKPKYIKRLVELLIKADSDKQDQTLS